MLRLTILFLYIFFVKCYENEEQEIDYYTNLIEESIQKANNYTVRSDNNDFFAEKESDEVKYFGTFDFIVVGGGASGSVVATRLTEVANWNVLLLEAGDLDDDLIYIPYLFTLLQRSDRNWGYSTTNQGPFACLGRTNNSCPYTRGKVLGGSSALNVFIWNRGSPLDYDRWFKQGNPGWSWQSILPLFKKLENYQSEYIDTNYRGFGGPINSAHHVPLPEEQFMEYVKANEKLGFNYVEDYLTERQIGVSRLQLTTLNGRRVTAASAYVRPNWKRFNFNVTLKAYVTKILINPLNKQAFGVQFIKDGQKYYATARKETIVSGGAINTPQLLMLSGIGPCDHLQKFGIKCIQDSPVGKRVIDHATILIPTESSSKPKTARPLRDLVRDYLHGYGSLSNIGNVFGITLANTRDPNSNVANINILPSIEDDVCLALPGQTNFKDEVTQELSNFTTCDSWSVQLVLYRPKSTGTVTLQSSNPRDFPLVNTGILSNEDDVEQLYEGVRLYQNIVKLMPYNITFPVFNFCSDHEHDSKDYWFCVIRHLAYNIYHISGTAKMGPARDPLAVVDNKLRVYGIENLRVADCSIIPELISGNVVAPAYVIGENAAQMIKRKYLRFRDDERVVDDFDKY